MGKDSGKEKEKEDSGFGFKDRAKAEETINLLQSHDMSYQRLTVRGLLGRAKRVLTLTKAEDKIKNIKGAMEVFEKWLEEYGKEHPSKSAKSSSKPAKKSSKSDDEGDEGDKNGEECKATGEKKEAAPSDKVQGLGFKDAEKAKETLKNLEGRDPDYQKLALKGLIGSAKRVLTSTRDKEKIQNMKDALAIFDDFLDEFDKTNQSKKNMSYLPLPVVEQCALLARQLGVATDRSDAFLGVYQRAGGDYKKIRTIEDKETGKTWDITRNKELNSFKDTIGGSHSELFEEDGNPTKNHLRLLVWAYSPEEIKMKKMKIKIGDADVEMKDESSKDDKSSSKDVKTSSKEGKESSRDEKNSSKDRKSSSHDGKSSSRDGKSSSRDSKSSSRDSKSSSDRKRKHSSDDSSSASNSDSESPNKRRK